MLFSSFIFLFLFLPVVFVSYFLINHRGYRNVVLLVFSLLFYAWGEPSYVILMILMIAINYGIAMFMNISKNKKALLVLSIIVNLGVLGIFKYSTFVVENINALFNIETAAPSIVLPIGISFYTFQIMSYIFDVYLERVKVQKNILYFACYVSLFPQLIAGPIVRYIDIEHDLMNRKETINDVHLGLRRFIIGLGKKVIISNNVAIIANAAFTAPIEELSSGFVWIGAIAFTLQIYFDFSGYSDMAIGLGRVFGFKFLENFNYPYISKSISEFWRRWHISLSSWFRDYVYFPLGGSRVKPLRIIFNLLVVWSLTGLWHGASWNFVFWGVYFFVILVLECFTIVKHITQIPVINHVYALLLIVVGWIIFNGTSVDQIIFMLKRLIDIDRSIFTIIEDMNYYYLLPHLIVGIVFSLPIVKVLKQKFEGKEFAELLADLFSIVVLIICVIYLVNDTYNPFIYFRF